MSLKILYGGQFTFSIQWIKPNYLVISPTDAAPPFLYKLAPAPKSTPSNHARDDSIYTPFCKLDFHSRVYPGFGACVCACVCVCVCVCVEKGRGRGMSERECAPPFVNFTSLKGTWRVLMTVGERLGEFWTPLSKIDLPSRVRDGEEVPMTRTFFLRMYLAYYIFKPTPKEAKFKKMKLGFFGP